MAPWADAIYACDGTWWDVHHAAVAASGFAGERWTQASQAALKHGLHYIGSQDGRGLGEPDVIHQGGNSGYQAANLAYLWGARAIVLLGLDCAPGDDGRAHWFGQHQHARLGKHQAYPMWRAKFPQLARDLADRGVRVINASRRTALECFERMALEDVPGVLA